MTCPPAFSIVRCSSSRNECRGLLSDVQRKNVEAMALDQKVPPRTLQRFLSDIVWDHPMLRDRCQRLIATEYAHPEAIIAILPNWEKQRMLWKRLVKRTWEAGSRQ